MAPPSTTTQNGYLHEDDIDKVILLEEIEIRSLIHDNLFKEYSDGNLKAKASEVCS